MPLQAILKRRLGRGQIDPPRITVSVLDQTQGEAKLIIVDL